MPVASDEFRKALSRWATGVTIVTARAGGQVHGMTVSAFNAVSLEPPLVLVCADKGSLTLGVIEAGGVFAVNVLARGQEELSTRFASKATEAHRFDGLACESGATGAPFIPGSLAVLDCRVTHALEAGDHWIYVGEVQEVRLSDRDPLLYYAGAYAHLHRGD